MKKNTKAQQLRLVRSVVRQLTPTDLHGVNGGLGVACHTNTGCNGNTGNHCPDGVTGTGCQIATF